jgi:hypothetical protein
VDLICVIYVDNGFYMIKFDHEADKEKVVSEGPWMIFDHYLAVSHWSPEFISPAAKVERTLVWIRFPGLNLVYYDERFLLAMASAVGKPIKVDTNTLKVERGRFARICVEVDLKEPVVGKVWLNGYWYKVEYEGLHIICSSCGRYGHHARHCTHHPMLQLQGGTTTEPEKPGDNGPVTFNAVNVVTDLGENTTVTNNNNNAANYGELKLNGRELRESNVQANIHGDWMVVTRRKKSQTVDWATKNNTSHGPERKVQGKPKTIMKSHAKGKAGPNEKIILGGSSKLGPGP